MDFRRSDPVVSPFIVAQKYTLLGVPDETQVPRSMRRQQQIQDFATIFQTLTAIYRKSQYLHFRRPQANWLVILWGMPKDTPYMD